MFIQITLQSTRLRVVTGYLMVGLESIFITSDHNFDRISTLPLRNRGEGGDGGVGGFKMCHTTGNRTRQTGHTDLFK